MLELSGKWIGFYEYGLGYELPYFSQRVKYQIEITSEGQDIIGTTSEEKSEFSVDSKATIKGFVDDDLVSFIKTYPIKSIIDEDDNLIKLSKGEQLIHHTGFLDREQMTMYGLWTIELHTLEKNEHYEPQQVEGIWLLKKQ